MKKKVIRLTEEDLHKIVENSVRRILKEENEATSYISNVVNVLSSIGVKTTVSNDNFLPIDKILRGSWYCEKAKELGFTDCIHIDLGHSFIGILLNSNDGNVKLMSGYNIMISDAFSNIFEEFGLDFNNLFNVLDKCNIDTYENDDDGLMLFDINSLKSFVNYVKKS